MSYNYRCSVSECRKRRTLRKKIELYMRRPKCPSCGADSLKYDPTEKIRTKSRTCRCDGLFYPHHKGTSVWCDHHPTGPTDEDWQERYR